MNDSCPLLIHRLLDRGPRLQPDNLLITKTRDGYHSISLREHMRRTYRLASACAAWGAKRGDVIASFCWNTGRHYQMYHAIPSMGCCLHTLNVRLSPKELVYIINHAEDRVIFVDGEAKRAAQCNHFCT